MKKTIIRISITLVSSLLLFYLMLPAINMQDISFWIYLLIVFIIFFVSGIIDFHINNCSVINKKMMYISFSIGFVFLVLVIINLFNSPLFNAKSYYSRIKIKEETNFLNDVKEVDFDSLPLLDKDSSEKLGDRVMGQMKDLVSQFEVSDLYTQINYNNKIIRVTPLEYANILKWFTNRKNGTKGYITVDSVTGEAKLTKLKNGMKYMPSALFNKNLYRHLRFKYPTLIFDDANFELDNDGNPFWIVPTIKYTGIGLKEEITGVIIVNPINGRTKKYKLSEIPSWIDHVFPARLIIEQVNDWGKYKNGYFNSIFSQKNVVATTDGYNYLLMDDDVYLYTGITSVNNDESNLGFILTNMRTKETKFYEVPGAEEYSAMDSAKGAVQQMKYEPTFPLLINLNNRPTYLMSLKDNAGLVKMYAFVDVQDYQKVVVTDSSLGIKEAAKNYLLNSNFKIDEKLLNTKEITIKKINDYVIDGTTYFYITDTENNKYRASIKIDDSLPFISSGSKITITFKKQNNITEISKIAYK